VARAWAGPSTLPNIRRCASFSSRRGAKAGLTQHEVAERLGRPQSFVAKVEGGERRLDVIEFIELTRALGVDPVRLIKRLLP